MKYDVQYNIVFPCLIWGIEADSLEDAKEKAKDVLDKLCPKDLEKSILGRLAWGDYEIDIIDSIISLVDGVVKI